MIVIGRGRSEIGLLADSVGEFVRVRERMIESSAIAQQAERRYFLGVTRDGLSVLDGAALLDAPELWTR